MGFNKYKILAILCLSVFAINTSQINAADQVILIKSKYQEQENSEQIQEIDNLKETIKDMKFQLLCAQNEIAKIQETNQNLAKILSQSEVNIQLLKNENNLLKQDVINKDKYIAELQNQKINNTNTVVNEQLLNLNNKNISLNNELVKIKEMYEIAQNKLINKERQLVTAQNQTELQFQISELKKQTNEKNSQITNLKNELSREKSSLISTKLNYENILKEKNTQIALMQSELALNENEIQNSATTINNLNNELNRIKTAMQSEVNRSKIAEEIIQSKEILLKQMKDELQQSKTQNVKEVSNEQAVYTVNIKTAYDYFNIAKAYQNAKDYKEAINNYKQAISLNSSFDKAYKELGLIYAEVGDFKNSSCCLKKCLLYSSNPKEAVVIKNFLSNIEKSANL
jgi:DNA repair exonuclease SbcCD ATPase subunit